MIDQYMEFDSDKEKFLFFAVKKLNFLRPQISALGSSHFTTMAEPSSSSKRNAPVSLTSFILLFFFLFFKIVL